MRSPPDAAWTEQERELLAAARDDRMPAELEARLREALELPPLSGGSVHQRNRTALSDTANAPQLFASKLPLWGVLSIVAIGALGYYALSAVGRQPIAARDPEPRARYEEAQREGTARAFPPPTHGRATDDVTASHGTEAQTPNTQDALQRAAAVTRREPQGDELESAQQGASKREAASAHNVLQQGVASAPARQRVDASERGAASALQQGVARRLPARQKDDASERGATSAQSALQQGPGYAQQAASEQGAANAHARQRVDASKREAASALQQGVAHRAPARQKDDGSERGAASAESALQQGVASAPVRQLVDGSHRSVRQGRDASAGRAIRQGSAGGEQSSALQVPPLMAAAPGPGESVRRPDEDAAHSATSDQLRMEAQLLERARSALGRGALSEARQWLNRYQARFARGALHPESRVLAIELQARSGARTAAETEAAHFLAEHPDHPLRERVQQLRLKAAE